METNMVTTVDGRIEEKINCRKMNGLYYVKGDINIENSGECYLIDDKYYKYNTGYIIFDNSVHKYVLKSTLKDKFYVEKGIIDFKNGNEPIFGSYSLEKNNDIYVLIINNKYSCINEDILKNNIHFLENLEDGIYYERNKLDSYKYVFPTKCSRDFKYSLSYDSRGLTEKAEKKYIESYKPELYHIGLESGKSDITKGLSFGLEFETSLGIVPLRICSNLGLIPLRDGSIDGLEYVTIPLKGKNGMQTVLDTLKVLKRRTVYNNDCSLHLHIGNIPRTEEFFLALFKILFILQDDMYSMFPFHKKENYEVKRKHYTKPLPLKETMLLFDSKIKTKEDIKRNFDILYRFLSMNQSYDAAGGKLSNIKSHPSDPGGNSKWNIKTRYYWVNLIPLLFGNKQTVEFRIHTPTYDSNKVINYMLTCFSIIDYVIKNETSILSNFQQHVNIDLNHVVFESYYKDFSNIRIVEELQRYFDCRKRHFFFKTKKGDFLANEDEFSYTPKYLNWESTNNKLNNSFKFSSNLSVPAYDNIGLDIQLNDAIRRVAARIDDNIRIVNPAFEENALFINNEPEQELPI